MKKIFNNLINGNLTPNNQSTQHKNNMKTVQEHLDSLASEFRKLSRSAQASLRRKAHRFVVEKPHMADHNGFWRGLSARHVLAAATK